jgi:hypothetical protein
MLKLLASISIGLYTKSIDFIFTSTLAGSYVGAAMLPWDRGYTSKLIQ